MWEADDYWECAVYWKSNGYGGSTRHATREAAVSEAIELTGPKYRFAECHIRHVVEGNPEVFKRAAKPGKG